MIGKSLVRPIVALFIAASVLLTAAGPAAADAQPPGTVQPAQLPPGVMSVDAAAKAVAAVFKIPVEFDGMNSNYSEQRYPVPRKVWNLNWYSRPQRGKFNAFASVDADTGEVLSFNRSPMFPPDGSGELRPIKYTEDEARPLAEAELKRIMPTRVADLRAVPQSKPYFYGRTLSGPVVHTFRWVRLANGLPVRGEGVTIGIDAADGQVTQYNFNWTPNLQFPSARPAIDATRAQAAWLEAMGIDLQAIEIYPREPMIAPGPAKPELRLVYGTRLPFRNVTIDAQTGAPVDSSGRAAIALKPIAGKDLPKPTVPVAELPKVQAPLGREDALKIATAAVTIPDGYTLNGASYHDGGPNGEPQWNFNWQKVVEPGGRFGPGGFIGAGVHALTGRIVNLNMGPSFPPGQKPPEPKFNRQQALQKAVDHAARLGYSLVSWDLQADLYQQTRFVEVSQHSYQLTPVVDGVRFPNASINVTVSAATGDLIGFWSNPRGPQPISGKDRVIGLEKATAIVREKMLLELGYQVIVDAVAAKFGRPPEGPPRVLLTYQLPESQVDAVVEAQTGRLIDRSGRELGSGGKQPPDVAGHWASREIGLVLARDLLELRDGKFEPDRAITRGEAARFLTLAFGRTPLGAGAASYGDVGAGHRLFGYVEAAAQAGIIDKPQTPGGANFGPDEVVSREEFALMVIRALGYGKIANMKAAIPLPYDDADRVEARYRNAVALGAGLDLFNPEGDFNPGAPVTRAQAAVIAVRMSGAAAR